MRYRDRGLLRQMARLVEASFAQNAVEPPFLKQREPKPDRAVAWFSSGPTEGIGESTLGLAIRHLSAVPKVPNATTTPGLLESCKWLKYDLGPCHVIDGTSYVPTPFSLELITVAHHYYLTYTQKLAQPINIIQDPYYIGTPLLWAPMCALVSICWLASRNANLSKYTTVRDVSYNVKRLLMYFEYNEPNKDHFVAATAAFLAPEEVESLRDYFDDIKMSGAARFPGPEDTATIAQAFSAIRMSDFEFLSIKYIDRSKDALDRELRLMKKSAIHELYKQHETTDSTLRLSRQTPHIYLVDYWFGDHRDVYLSLEYYADADRTTPKTTRRVGLKLRSLNTYCALDRLFGVSFDGVFYPVVAAENQRAGAMRLLAKTSIELVD